MLVALAASLYYKYRVAPEIDFKQLQLTDLYGNKVSLSDYAGEKTFVGFFATWCGPCLREIPELELADKSLKAKGISVVLISDEPVERLQSFEMRKSVKLTILHSVQPLSELGVHTIPTNYILNNRLDAEKKLVDGSGEKLKELLDHLR